MFEITKGDTYSGVNFECPDIVKDDDGNGSADGQFQLHKRDESGMVTTAISK